MKSQFLLIWIYVYKFWIMTKTKTIVRICIHSDVASHYYFVFSSHVFIYFFTSLLRPFLRGILAFF